MSESQILKTKTIRNLGPIDITELQSIVKNLPEKLWAVETKNRENNYSVFQSTEHIVFKFNTTLEDHTHYMVKPLWNLWKDKLNPLINKAVEPYGYKKGVVPKAMFARLLPFQQIDMHTDSAPRNYHCHKIHIPIVTHPDIDFIINGVTYNLEEGFAYEVNNVVRHGVINRSPVSRIHLIFEYFEVLDEENENA